MLGGDEMGLEGLLNFHLLFQKTWVGLGNPTILCNPTTRATLQYIAYIPTKRATPLCIHMVLSCICMLTFSGRTAGPN